MKFELVRLPYTNGGLEPVISEQIIDFHYGEHLLNYVNTLNKLIEGTKFENASLGQTVRGSDEAILNNAGQMLNHDLYFTQFSPNGGGEPAGKLVKAIKSTWGSFENFQKELVAAGTGLLDLGWVWLARDKDGKLSITKEPNGSNPIVKGSTPIMGFDVWEYSYYLDYQNRCADRSSALQRTIDRETVGERY